MKVVCIKECSYSFTRLDYYFNIGDQFELSKNQPTTYYTSLDRNPDKISIIITIDGNSYDVRVLKNDFTTLEQWRDKQLNLILDENNMYK
jgi:hypothetical protein